MKKVIELLKDFIISMSGAPEDKAEEKAEALYDRIAPLFEEDRMMVDLTKLKKRKPHIIIDDDAEREFSEEVDFEVRHILAEFSTKSAMSQDDAVERFKRLWEGDSMICRECGHSAYSSTDSMDCKHDYPIFDKPKEPEREIPDKLADKEVTVMIPGVEEDGATSYSYHTGRLTKDSIKSLRIVQEFPEEAVRNTIAEILHPGHSIEVSATVHSLKRLWEGTGEQKLDEIIEMVKKSHIPDGGCTTCGGSGDIRYSDGKGHPCDDCDGTGERRKVKRRTGAKCCRALRDRRKDLETGLNYPVSWDNGRRDGKDRRGEKTHNAK